ncbi:DNA polymerase I [Anaerocolumna sedimenticola]|uniref:DNA polymerase I n=1 Tax=Anaerocolumna sedimenticola TaxID=2696063 RepID=A0A6P1TPI1_9FIRM|nr:DNA polymerase I [Anaerocolumna sedimenticola]QHQ62109.1 DNA polymerase I [Anaerocolumna sedimenticola]
MRRRKVKKIVLIDGHSILNRAFYAIPDLTNSEGIHTNAILGFLNIMFKILDEEKPEYLTVAFDVHQPTFRHEMFEQYKGTRKSMPEELREQVPLMKEVLKAMGITIMEKPGYEADDVLGTIAKTSEQKGYQVSLVSGDRDLLQLASENIKIRIPKTKKGGTEIENYNTQDVIETYGVTPKQFIDLKGLMGDTSDNIPGVPGIGEKTAGKIISTYDSIENAYEHLEEIGPAKAKEALRNNHDLAILSKTLATIKTDCDIEFHLEDALVGNLYNEGAYSFFKRLEFKSLLNRFQLEVTHYEGIEEYFKVLNDLEQAEMVFNKLLKSASGHMTAGLQFITAGDKILGLSLTYSDKDIYFIKVEGFITEEYLKDKVCNLLDTPISLATINLKPQLDYIRAAEKSNVFDEGIAAYLLNPLNSTYYYDDIARDYLKMTIPSMNDLFGKNDIANLSSENDKEFRNYCCYQSYVCYKAYEPLVDALKNTDMYQLFVTIEMPLVYTLYDMELRGIHINREELKKYGEKLAVGIADLETKIYHLVGEEFNINSPKQLGVILFEKLRLPFGKKTKTGYSTSADILDKLVQEHPVVSMILEYRQLTKLKSTYADGLATYIGNDERIHGKFHQTIAATGRISSTEPNLQNIPIRMELGREIRKVFIPEDGYIFLDADYSQIELRVLAHMSEDERLIAAYREAQDIHRITASQVFHTPLDEVTPLQRSNAKAVNFGIVYGISSFGLGQGLNISRKEAEDYINRYFETYPRVKQYLDDLVLNGKKNGYVTTLFGRRRPIPELSSSNFMQRSFGERVAMNSPIQGTAADIIKIAMIRVNERLKELKLRSRLILQIHDELLIEAHKEEIEEVSSILKEEMQKAANMSIPLEVEVKTGTNWYEAK